MALYLGKSPIGNVSISFTSSDGGINTNDSTLSSGNQMLEGVTAYSKGTKYTGSIKNRTAAQIAVSGNIVTIPSGYYSEEVKKSVSTTTVATPSITVSDSGLITASTNQSAGYVSEDTKSATKQLTTKGATTVTPNSSAQTVVNAGTYVTGNVNVAAVPTETKNITSNGTHTPASGKYFSSVTVQVPSEEFTTQTKTITPTKSQQTVVPDNGYDGLSSVTVDAIPNEYITTSDANAVAADLAEGKTAYVNGQKITGTHTCSTGGGGIDTSDATATAEDIVQGKTAYVNNEKITGTMVVQSFYTLDSTPSNDFGIEGDICVVRIGG